MLLFGGCTKCGGGGLFRSRASAFLLLEDTRTVEVGASVPVLAGGAFHSQRVDSVGGGAFLN